MKKFLMIALAFTFLIFFGSSSSLVADECDSKDAQEQKKQETKEVTEGKKDGGSPLLAEEGVGGGEERKGLLDGVQSLVVAEDHPG